MDVTDPLARFDAWLEEARAAGVAQPETMALATVAADGRPSCRMVLLKHADQRGFVFYTNAESRKGDELAANPVASLCIYWEACGRQVRVRGHVESVTGEEADAYFATRPRESQLGAWASQQSRPLSGRAELEQRFAEVGTRHDGQQVPRPPHWSGFRVVPDEIELWEQGEHRLHHRELFTRTGAQWRTTLLYP